MCKCVGLVMGYCLSQVLEEITTLMLKSRRVFARTYIYFIFKFVDDNYVGNSCKEYQKVRI